MLLKHVLFKAVCEAHIDTVPNFELTCDALRLPSGCQALRQACQAALDKHEEHGRTLSATLTPGIATSYRGSKLLYPPTFCSRRAQTIVAYALAILPVGAGAQIPAPSSGASEGCPSIDAPRSSRSQMKLADASVIEGLKAIVAFEYNLPRFVKTVTHHSDAELSDDEDVLQLSEQPADWEGANPGIVLHHCTWCSSCGEDPIVERRYFCQPCNINFCEICFTRSAHKHDVLCKSVSEHPRPSGPLRFAIKEIVSHTGRKTARGDSRLFTVNFKGFFWKHEEIDAAALPPGLIADYEARNVKRRKRRRSVKTDPLVKLVAARRRRVQRAMGKQTAHSEAVTLPSPSPSLSPSPPPPPPPPPS